MRVLTFDPGKKCGWAVLESSLDGPKHMASGTLHFPREGKETYQDYRLRLTLAIQKNTRRLCQLYAPDRVIVEIVPAQGSYGFMTSGQSYIANVTATTIHGVAMDRLIPLEQVSARSWQSRIAKRGKSKKITKPQIRNGVLVFLPDLRKDLAEYLMAWDRWDAIGIALFSLGYQTA